MTRATFCAIAAEEMIGPAIAALIWDGLDEPDETGETVDELLTWDSVVATVRAARGVLKSEAEVELLERAWKL